MEQTKLLNFGDFTIVRSVKEKLTDSERSVEILLIFITKQRSVRGSISCQKFQDGRSICHCTKREMEQIDFVTSLSHGKLNLTTFSIVLSL